MGVPLLLSIVALLLLHSIALMTANEDMKSFNYRKYFMITHNHVYEMYTDMEDSILNTFGKILTITFFTVILYLLKIPAIPLRYIFIGIFKVLEILFIKKG